MRRARTALAILTALVVHLACSSPPDAPPRSAVAAGAGIQVWNHTAASRTVAVHAIDADGANRLVATVVVPDRRDRVDPSLGGDPHAVRSAALDLRHGEQRLHVVDDRGRSTTVALAAPAHGWAIVFVGADRLEALADSGPRGLD